MPAAREPDSPASSPGRNSRAMTRPGSAAFFFGGPPRVATQRARVPATANPLESQLLLTARLAEETSVKENGQ